VDQHEFVRCALVPGRGLPILFEHPNSMHLFGEIDAHVPPMHAWEFTDDAGSHLQIFAREAVSAMRELGVTDDRLAIHRLGTPGFLAFQAAGISVFDSSPVTMEAREVKTPEGIEVPAIGGEHLATNTVWSGPNTNPWRAEATARVLERGDLVYADTDAVCLGGLFLLHLADVPVRRFRPHASATRGLSSITRLDGGDEGTSSALA
jgi:Xaa-Pro aminopeptidase